MVTIGKPMANGHPISAVVTSHEIAEKFVETQEEESLNEVCVSYLTLLSRNDGWLCPGPVHQ